MKKPGPKPSKLGKCIRKSISIPLKLWKQWEQEAEREGKSMSAYIIERMTK